MNLWVFWIINFLFFNRLLFDLLFFLFCLFFFLLFLLLFFFLLLLLFLFLPFIHNLTVPSIDSSFHNPSCSKITNLLHLLFNIFFCLKVKHLLLYFHNIIKFELHVKHFKLLVEASQSQFIGFGMMNHQSMFRIILYQNPSSLNVPNNHVLFNYFFGSKTFINKTLNRPFTLISFELQLFILKHLE